MTVGRISEALVAVAGEGSEKLTPRDTQAEHGGEGARLREPSALKHSMPYKPSELKDIFLKIARVSDAKKVHILERNYSKSLKGDGGEYAVQKGLEAFGRVEKLPVRRGEGERTADFKVTLHRDIRFGKQLYRAGEVIIVEVKNGKRGTIRSEIATHDSHARQQLKRTIEREGAVGGIIIVPREMQKDGVWVAARKAEMAANPEESRSTISMSIPHEGAMRSGMNQAAEALESVANSDL